MDWEDHKLTCSRKYKRLCMKNWKKEKTKVLCVKNGNKEKIGVVCLKRERKEESSRLDMEIE